MAQAIAESGENDVVVLAKADRPYTVKPVHGDFVNISHTLTIRSERERAKLNCSAGEAAMFRVFDPEHGGRRPSKLVTLTLDNVEVSGCVGSWRAPGVVRVANAAVKIHNCKLAHVGTVLDHPAAASEPCDVAKISIVGSELETCGVVKPYVPCIVLRNCNTTNAVIVDTRLRSVAVRLQANRNLLLELTNVTWFGRDVRGPLLDVELAPNRSTVSLTGTTISSHEGRTSPVVIAAECEIRSPMVAFNDVAFVNNTFTKTLGGAVALLAQSEKKPVTLNVRFKGCRFFGNSATDAGGALYIEGVDSVQINHCTFEENVAKDGGAVLIAGSTNVSLYNDSFIKNQATGKSNGSKFGVGGAVHILDGDLLLTECTFNDNKARYQGQAIHATGMTQAYITFSKFLTSTPFPDAAPRSEVYLEQQHSTDAESPTLAVRLIKNRFVDNETAIQHGLYNVRTTGQMDINQNELCCPDNHYLDRLSQLRYDLPGFDTGSSIEYVSCVACPVGTYNLQQHCFSADRTAMMKEAKNLCSKCPALAKCLGDGQIVAPRNHWGLAKYKTANEVTFFSCPPEYCDPDDCHSIECCSKNRTGVLCGRCQPGHRFNLGTGSCISDFACHGTSTRTMLWAAAFGFIYLTVIGLFVMLMRLVQKHVSPLLLTDTSVNSAWSCDGDDGVAASGSQQTTDQPAGGRYHLDSDEGSDSFEPSLVPSSANDTEAQSLLPVLNEETQTSAKFCLNMSASTEVNPVTDLPYACCVFWMLMQLLEDAYWPLYGNGSQNSIIRIILDLINLRPAYYILTAACTAGDAAAIFKAALTLLTFGTMIITLVLIMVFGHIILKLISLVRGTPTSHPRAHFDAVLCKMFIILTMLIYLPALKSCLQLVHCIQLDPESQMVLFMNGTLACYQWWQWLVVTFIITNMVPVGLMIWMSLTLVKSHLVSHVQFITGLTCPLVTIIYWSCRHCHLACTWLFPGESRLHVMQAEMAEANQDYFMATDVICTFFIRPFKLQPNQCARNSSKVGSTAWIVFTFARAFILASISVMLNHAPHIRCLVMASLLAVTTVLHTLSQPYQARLINRIETGILAILLLLAVISLNNSLAYITDIQFLQYIHNTGYVSNLIFIIITSLMVIGYLATVIVNSLKPKERLNLIN